MMFYTYAPLWRINYAADLEVDGGADGRAVFGEIALRAWQSALADWQAFGRRDIVATTGEIVQLASVDALLKEHDRLDDQLEAVAGDVHARMVEEKRNALPPEERELLLEQLRDPARRNEVNQLTGKTYVSWEEVVEQLAGEKKKRAEALSLRRSEVADLYARTDNYSNQINYADWLLRCTYESEEATVQAREHIYKGELALQVDADMLAAQEFYEKGFAKWRLVLDKHKELLNDNLLLQELIEPIHRYQQVMVNGLDNEFPDPFVLQDVMDAHARMQQRGQRPDPQAMPGGMPGVASP